MESRSTECCRTKMSFIRQKRLAPWGGIEPATFRLTVERSTAELPGNAGIVDSEGAKTKAYRGCKAASDAAAGLSRESRRQPSREWDGPPAEAPKARRLEATPGIA